MGKKLSPALISLLIMLSGQEQAPAEVKPEQRRRRRKKQRRRKKKTKRAEGEPKPPLPFVLFESRTVMIDMAQNQVTIKGIVEPQAVAIG
ncbi:hypothetical protein CK203_114830 [Vitis vinifera]|uniref:Uncharacterized protein n=1 Tax=Vitis vinifera TaxID=29760 RepID=A0A438FEM7_VITVI|nr:hypothetical protein CK203_114830 [Vitis vinifera]